MSDLTRAEVIELLDGDWDFWEEFVSPKGIEALKYAISSLKTDETYQIEYENRDFIEILEGATNGDMIKALFPELKLSVTDGKVFVRNEGDIYLQMCFSWEWWNSPYRKEQE